MAKIEQVWYGCLEDTPIDHLWVAVAACGLAAVMFRHEEDDFRQYVKKLTKVEPEHSMEKVAPAARQLTDYLNGELREFTLDICWDVMTDFQQKSLRAVYGIPYGEIRTYSQIAQTIGKPKAIRAVGRANATNPMPVVVPCHRVIGSDGKLRGFGGGLETKAHLLRMEGSWLL